MIAFHQEDPGFESGSGPVWVKFAYSPHGRVDFLQVTVGTVLQSWPTDQLTGLLGRVSALRLGGCGFDPQTGHVKDYKNGHCLPACRSTLRGVAWLDHLMIHTTVSGTLTFKDMVNWRL